MTATYDSIATTTLTSAQSSVTFSSISGSYTDLVLVLNGSQTDQFNVRFRINGDTGNNYSDTGITGNGSTATSNRDSNEPYIWFGVIGTSQTTALFYIMNYSNTTTNKTVLHRMSNAGGFAQASVGLWRSTSAVTQVTLLSGGNFTSGSTFTLYGIKSE